MSILVCFLKISFFFLLSFISKLGKSSVKLVYSSRTLFKPLTEKVNVHGKQNKGHYDSSLQRRLLQSYQGEKPWRKQLDF
jgi:hypothetical protein